MHFRPSPITGSSRAEYLDRLGGTLWPAGGQRVIIKVKSLVTEEETMGKSLLWIPALMLVASAAAADNLCPGGAQSCREQPAAPQGSFAPWLLLPSGTWRTLVSRALFGEKRRCIPFRKFHARHASKGFAGCELGVIAERFGV